MITAYTALSQFRDDFPRLALAFESMRMKAGSVSGSAAGGVARLHALVTPPSNTGVNKRQSVTVFRSSQISSELL